MIRKCIAGGDAYASSKVTEVVDLLAVAPHGETLNPDTLTPARGGRGIVGAANSQTISLLGRGVDGNPDTHGAGNDKVVSNGIHNQWA
jgi:hypothetical protein